MNSSGPNRSKERVVSILLFILLLLIPCVVVYSHHYFDPSDWGFVQAEEVDGNGSRQTQSNLVFECPGGFGLLGPAEIFDADNLYAKINGKAPLYTESGFELLTTQRFVSDADSELWAEVYAYEMGDFLNAFSVYSTQRRPDGEELSSLDFAYVSGNAGFAVVGEYYLEVVASQATAEMQAAIQKVLENFARDSSASMSLPDEIKILKVDGFIQGSLRLYLEETFGFGGFRDTFVADYDVEGETLTGFMMRFSTEQQAIEALQGYADFLKKEGAKIVSSQQDTFTILEFYGFYEGVLTSGEFLAGVHEAPSQQMCERLLKRIVESQKVQIKQE